MGSYSTSSVFGGLHEGYVNSDKDIIRFEKLKFKNFKNARLSADHVMIMMNAINILREKFGLNPADFYKTPKKYQKFLDNAQGTLRTQSTSDAFLNMTIKSKFYMTLKELLNFDQFSDETKMKEFIEDIGPSMGGTRNFVYYLRSIAIVLGNLLEYEIPLSALMCLLILPVQKFFKENNPMNYVRIIGYCGLAAIPEDLTTFVKRQHEILNRHDGWDPETSSKFETPIKIETEIAICLLIEPQNYLVKKDFMNRLTFIFRKYHDHTDIQAKCVESFLNEKYMSIVKTRRMYRMNVHNLPEIRTQLVASRQTCITHIETLSQETKEIARKYVIGLFDRAFADVSKLEIGLRLLKKMFTGNPMTVAALQSPPSTSTNNAQLPSSSNSPNYFLTQFPTPPSPLAPPSNMHLLPAARDGPVFELIPMGPAPEGWENDPAWQEHQFSLTGSIFYQDNEFHLVHNLD